MENVFIRGMGSKQKVALNVLKHTLVSESLKSDNFVFEKDQFWKLSATKQPLQPQLQTQYPEDKSPPLFRDGATTKFTSPQKFL